MTRPYDKNFDAETCSAEPHRAAPSDREASMPHPLFDSADPFEAAITRVAILDLNEDYSGCRPFIAATAKLPPDVRRRLLVNASGALLDFCDHHGAAECLKHALGLEHEEPSDELDQVIDDGLRAIAEAAGQDSEEDDDDEEDAWSTEDLIRLIAEVHQTPSS
jgi:hypothetical protein